ncbi:hypothetical protein DP113_15220 [Brasilonema octagenarum UFV-E1]|jgi:hypothetical protein|uniref:Microviridin/marinostatin family tricyclic proteinase inhibitor n=2 Tax=Brasilonema TaxID=383614 RepID=A0A856MHG6_9CYAN|nr:MULTISPECIES: microviridin/marinostatin family tricyclic proteinase inhibitor [Brasilonema]NMF61289.1 hypothetical protein [Brasilonema octagenarum UFV-OR1]QDL09081.1 hypothetical protein DP114_15280 [Brasilonema sennae CENA114]QDL15439.1 hypothetical protein DP113_15220 [Brasilonema octagenarum UFV-E1]
MSENTIIKPSDVKAAPFFARFLEEQGVQQSDEDKPQTPPPFTFKYPSDWEDR